VKADTLVLGPLFAQGSYKAQGIARPAEDQLIVVALLRGHAMEPKKRSRIWAWVGGILLGLTLAGIAVVGTVAILVVVGVVELSKAFSSETHATIVPRTVNGQVEFEMGYGKDVTALSVFIVRDMEGNELWRLDGRSSQKPPKLVYGVLPSGSAGEWEQVFPTGGARPVDIRGKRVTVEANCGFVVAFGAGHQSTHAEFDIPK
jgi:hypothetical protein